MASSYLNYEKWYIDDEDVVHSTDGAILGAVSAQFPDRCTIVWTYTIDSSRIMQNFAGKIIGDQDLAVRLELSFKSANFETMRYVERRHQGDDSVYGGFMFTGDENLVKVYRFGSIKRNWQRASEFVDFVGFPLGLNRYDISLMFPSVLKKDFVDFMKETQLRCGSIGTGVVGDTKLEEQGSPDRSSAPSEVSQKDIAAFVQQVRSCITIPDGLPDDSFVKVSAHIDRSGMSEPPEILSFFPKTSVGATYAASASEALVRCGPYQLVDQDIEVTFAPIPE